MKSSEFIREIKKKGWLLIRQGKGSHEIYGKDGKEFQFQIMVQRKWERE